MSNGKAAVLVVNFIKLGIDLSEKTESELVLFWGTIAVSELGNVLDESLLDFTDLGCLSVAIGEVLVNVNEGCCFAKSGNHGYLIVCNYK